MKRLIDYDLKQWVTSARRKPLLLRGARQVGKTHAVRELGKIFDNFVEINFEFAKDAHVYFEDELDPQKIIDSLSLLKEQPIVPGKTLLFFDEIQEMPRVLTSLRYFYEMMPELHVVAAGSLLDFTIEAIGIPVGRVMSLYMYPMTFIEFLHAIDKTLLIEEILKHPLEVKMSEPIHKRLLEHVSHYLAIGGMPEAVECWKETKLPNECALVHNTIVDSYRQDFGTYSKKFQIKYVDLIFNSVPKQLGERFKYSEVEGGYRKRDLAPCLELLSAAGVIHKVHHTDANGIPLGAEVNLEYFKVVLMDVAIAQTILGIQLAPWFLYPLRELVNQGYIVEAFVGQEILGYSSSLKKGNLYYWLNPSRTGQAEVDYVVQDFEQVIPIEVKSGDGKTLASLHTFLESHPSPYGIRFSSQNYSNYNKVHSYPLYAIAKSLQIFEDVTKKIL